MKKLALALALLCLPGLALAQSDSRKVAVFWQNGDNIGYDTQQGQFSNNGIQSYFMQIVLDCLNKMGVPYTIFNLQDSTGGWRSQMGSARPAGTADSTWFRQNGYLGCIFVNQRITLGVDTVQPVKMFTSGTVVGVQRAGPLGGFWGIPTVAIMQNPANDSSAPWRSGAVQVTEGAGVNRHKGAFANGDSINLYTVYTYRKSETDSCTVTPYIYGGDTLDATGTRMKAWRLNNSTWIFPYASGFNSQTVVLLALSTLFDEADYTVRRKLNFHITDDHVYPNEFTAGVIDSFYAYMRFNRWKEVGLMCAESSSEYQTAPVLARAAVDLNRDIYAAGPHDHQKYSAIGSWWSYDLATWADSTKFRERINMAIASISDTLLYNLATGYEAFWVPPGTQLLYAHVPAIIQAGYRYLRTWTTDSTGVSANFSYPLKLTNPTSFGYTAGYNAQSIPSPYLYCDPVTKQLVWIVFSTSSIGSDDEVWADVPYNTVNAIEDKMSRFLGFMANMTIYDADWYWHSEQNLKGNAGAGSDLFMAAHMRHLTYLMGRIKNICTVKPIFHTKQPRRHNETWTAYDAGGWFQGRVGGP